MDDQMTSAKLIIEVQAGVIPGTPMPELTRRWAFSSDDWEKIHGDNPVMRRVALDEWDKMHGWAREYAARLMNPTELNWVTMTWTWL